MNKQRILLLIIAVLAVVNIITLVMLMKRPHHPHHHEKGESKLRVMLRTEVGFDEQQLAVYDTLANQQRKKMRASAEKREASTPVIYETLAANQYNDSIIDVFAQQQASDQSNFFKDYLQYLRDVRAIGNSDQQLKFDQHISDIFKHRPDSKH